MRVEHRLLLLARSVGRDADFDPEYEKCARRRATINQDDDLSFARYSVVMISLKIGALRRKQCASFTCKNIDSRTTVRDY